MQAKCLSLAVDLALYSSTAGLSYDTQFGLRNIL